MECFPASNWDPITAFDRLSLLLAGDVEQNPGPDCDPLYEVIRRVLGSYAPYEPDEQSLRGLFGRPLSALLVPLISEALEMRHPWTPRAIFLTGLDVFANAVALVRARRQGQVDLHWQHSSGAPYITADEQEAVIGDLQSSDAALELARNLAQA
jgi:hypothetical protein